MPATRIKYVDGKVQYGKGRAASVIGQTYDAFRLKETTNESIISGAPIYSQFPAKIQRTTKRFAIENNSFELLVYEFTCDKRKLELGDTLVETGYGSDGGIYVFAEERPLKPNLFVRAESMVSITRPSPYGGQAEQQPTSGAIYQPKYGGAPKATEKILTLTDGLYSFEASGTYAAVPSGLQPRTSVKGLHKIEMPTQVPQTEFANFLPLLPGIPAILENDIINYENGDRYQVVESFTTGDTGLQGWFLLTYKIGV